MIRITSTNVRTRRVSVMFNDAATPDEAIKGTIAALISEGGARFLPELVISAADIFIVP